MTEAPDHLVDGPADADWTVVLGHGAGAPMDSPFMTTVAEGLAAHGHRVVRFEFPYMRRRRTEGVKAGPNPLAALQQAFRGVVEAVRPASGRLAVGGKSLGGRVASTVADALDADALVVLGYPFHPPGRPDRPRTDHLAALRTPALVVQGERDPFGDPEDVRGYALASTLQVVWMPDGDHGLAPRRASGHTLEGHLAEAVAAIDGFLRVI